MQHIIYNQSGHVGRVIFNRPEVLNAFNYEMLLEFKELLLKISHDENVHVVVVSGNGKAFSAGVDIKSTTAEGFQKGGEFMALGNEVSNLLSHIKKVFIAQVHGFCFTGALELMLFFDMAYCSEDTQFGDTHARWAIMPRWGMSQRLSRRVGLNKAKELTFRAMRINGKEAARIGLVNQAFAAADLTLEVDKVIDDILANNMEAIGAIKQLYDDGYATTLKEGLQIEADADSHLSGTNEQLQKFQKNKQ